MCGLQKVQRFLTPHISADRSLSAKMPKSDSVLLSEAMQLSAGAAVVGNSTELKNSILFDGVQTPHYNYIGDSILGYKSHTGAGVITSNLKSDKSLVTVLCDGDKVDTNVKKFGAMLGDHVEVGCNSVLNPGSVIGRNTNIYPLSFVRGYVPENSIYKRLGEVAEKIE